MSAKIRPGGRGEVGAGAFLVLAAIAAQIWFMGRAVVGLDVALAVSYALWAVRPAPASPTRVLPVLVIAGLVQVAHLAEEYRAGFQRAFPALLGYTWEDGQFLAFNFAWLALFAASALAIASGRRLGSLAVYFLAIGGGIANGLAHLALALRAGRYFPGLYTAPLCLAAGVLLLARLQERPTNGPQSSSG